MITALCHGKLSKELEGLEDLLTSAVFSRLRYMPLNEGLADFLSFSTFPDKSPLFPSNLTIESAVFRFWPWWQSGDCQGAEPDLVIDLRTSDGMQYKLLIEAKFRSGKSSETDFEAPVPVDQLAREWDNLTSQCEAEHCVPLMIYLTADFGSPSDDLAQSAHEYDTKRNLSKFPFRCAWLSWRHLRPALSHRASEAAKDIISLVDRLDLVFYQGVSPIHVQPWLWRFQQRISPFAFAIPQLEKWTWAFLK